MRDQEQSLNEANRAKKRTAEEAEQIAKDQVRKKAYLAREEAIEKASKASETKRMQKRAAEEIGQSTKDQARKDASLAKERAIADAQEARKHKAKKQPPQ